MPEPTDLHHLIERSKLGDSTAFAGLIRMHQQYAQTLALRLLLDEEEAREATQEAFVRVWQHLPRFDEGVKFTTWLYTIVTNICLDTLRARKRSRALFVPYPVDELPDSLDIEARHDNEQLLNLIRSLSSRLTEAQRLVFTLRDLQDLSVEEVREISGMNANTIKTHLCNARRNIRALLQAMHEKERK
ncbi:MAG: RNA polymerase sigma factor [Bacteroidia bacterium]|nr:RNA polymerase sigma factor [Bacteroidia bacterium]